VNTDARRPHDAPTFGTGPKSVPSLVFWRLFPTHLAASAFFPVKLALKLRQVLPSLDANGAQ
jgi:hypothetical protein